MLRLAEIAAGASASKQRLRDCPALTMISITASSSAIILYYSSLLKGNNKA
ncbi:hypothetical protein BN130_524 [Cronobacter malonaticus 507]|nr:hypothetical protein BN130_524 [Cronobacter malonaticus 507]